MLVLAVAAFWFLVLAPKRDEIVKLDAGIAKQEAAVAASEQLAAGYAEAKGDYRTNYTTVARLGKAVTVRRRCPLAAVQIDDAATRAKVRFRSLNVTAAATAEEDKSTPAGALAPAPGTVPVGSAGFSAMPFTFSFSGSFFRLSDFFQRLEHFVTVQNDRIDVTGRLLLIGSIAVTPDAGDLGKLEAKIGAATYLVPPTAGVPGEPIPGRDPPRRTRPFPPTRRSLEHR